MFKFNEDRRCEMCKEGCFNFTENDERKMDVAGCLNRMFLIFVRCLKSGRIEKDLQTDFQLFLNEKEKVHVLLGQIKTI